MSRVLSTAVSVFLLTYVTARAIRVPFTYDEAATYFRFIAADPLTIFSFPVATNHLLHTVVVRAAHAVGGSAEWVLRLPSVIAFALFAWFSIRLLDRLADRAIAIAGLVLLLSNPYLLEFFALSRGYGLAIALLFGSIFFLLQYLDDGDGDRDRQSRRLARALTLAVLAVAANFTLLNVVIGVFGVAFVVSISRHRGVRQGAATDSAGRPPWRSMTALALFAVAFVPAVLSQDLGLSERLYQPVTVTLDGPATDRVAVHRLDVRGRASRLSMDQGRWSLPRRQHVASLRIEVPRDADGTVERITVDIGGYRLRSVGLDREFWTVRDAGPIRIYESTAALIATPSRVPAFRAVINWSGDAVHTREVAVRAAVLLVLLILLGGVLELAGRRLQKRTLVPPGEWRAMAVASLWLVTVTAIPLYLLKRDGELYFGGTEGFLKDTVGSLIEDAFYGANYTASQAQLLSAFLLATLAAALGVLFVHNRRALRLPVGSLAVVLTLIVVAVVIQTVEQVALTTPSLIGRTALFYIPLFLLLAAFAFDAVAANGRAPRALAVATMVAAAVASTAHFANTANVTHSRDWRGDASTRLMIEDLEHAAGQAAESRIRLAVYPFFYPVTMFYAGKSRLAIDVEVVPPRAGADFMFLRDGSLEDGMEVVSRYSLTRNVLVRSRPSR